MIKISKTPFLPQQVIDALQTKASGSVVVHAALVRPSSEGQELAAIEYEMDNGDATKELAQIEKNIRTEWAIQDIALWRRTGKLILGDIILVAAVSSPHRKEAFTACEKAVEQMRNMTSVKKREIYE